MTNSYTSCLSINRMRLSVRLGYEKEERALAQSVDVDMKLYYPDLTAACRTDDGDYSCYDKLSRKIQQLCEGKEFRLIEYLCTEIYNTARAQLAEDIKIRVTVTKCGLPVGFVLGGASFSYTDLPPFSWIVPE